MGEFWCTEDEYAQTVLDSEYWKSLDCTLENIKSKGAVRIYPEGDKLGSADVLATETGRIQLYQETAVPNNVATVEFDISKERGLYGKPRSSLGRIANTVNNILTACCPSICAPIRTRNGGSAVTCASSSESLSCASIPTTLPSWASWKAIRFAFTTTRVCGHEGAISAGLPRKMVSSGRSWQKDDFIDGHFANLSSKDYNPMIANQAFNDVAVAIEKL